MWVIVQLRGCQTDLLHQLGRTGAATERIVIAVDQQRLGNLVAHRHARVKRGHRILKHDLGIGGKAASRSRRHCANCLTSNRDLPLMWDKPDNGARDGGFTAARLAHKRKCLACTDVKADAFNRMHAVGNAVQNPAADIKTDFNLAQIGDDGRIGGRLCVAALSHMRHSGQQLAGIALRGGRKNLGDIASFHHAALTHDNNAVGHFGDDAHVVRDQ